MGAGEDPCLAGTAGQSGVSACDTPPESPMCPLTHCGLPVLRVAPHNPLHVSHNLPSCVLTSDWGLETHTPTHARGPICVTVPSRVTPACVPLGPRQPYNLPDTRASLAGTAACVPQVAHGPACVPVTGRALSPPIRRECRTPRFAARPPA